MDKDELQVAVDAIPYWYHRIELPHGIVTPGWAPINPEAYGIPERMDGERVLDVGAWDGYWTFEALKRGANRVIAVDDFSDTLGSVHNVDRKYQWQTIDLCASALSHRCSFYISSEDQIRKLDTSIEVAYIGEWQPGRGGVLATWYNPESWSGMELDRIFMFGVLYHLRNPLKALQNCFDATKPGGYIHVETAILDNLTSAYTGKQHDPNGCYAEFYPTDEYGKNQSNWWVPTLKCAAAWLQAVGYVDIEGWKLTEQPKSLAECRGFLRAKKPS